MVEVSDRLSQQKEVPPKTKTEFQSFCLTTMMWVHHLVPTSITELKTLVTLITLRVIVTSLILAVISVDNLYAAIQESEILALAEEDMVEVSDRLSQHKEVPPKTNTEFQSFCLATMMWVHHLGPTSIKELKGAWYTPKKQTCYRCPGRVPEESPEDAHPLATYPTDDTTDTPRLHDSITYKVPQIQPIVNKPAAAPAPRQHSTTEETTPSTGDWKNLPHTR
ncbi:hypothetical protein ROHU_028666 [Labeo rohita]|uniref:Uncharacterized protein n=1 Tax=Labeo rohita TaxID=84645 RepID=A0A498MBC5_LABRO|nr:hypothetical protein ROHU_028666 [Labeo rohita]